MPGYTTEIGPKGKTIARATLRVPGNWPGGMTFQQQAAWNKATSAIDALMRLYAPSE
jgi:hypothetical protein